MRYQGLIMIAALALMVPAAAGAQAAAPDPVDQRVAELLETARAAYGVRDPRDRCRRSAEGEIVVCIDRGEDMRVPSTAESDPDSREARHARDADVMRAPQLDRGSCKGQPGCVTGGWAPPPIYEVDVSQLPQAPEGSDADRIARGELPAP